MPIDLTQGQRDTIEAIVAIFETGAPIGPVAWCTAAVLDGSAVSCVSQATAASLPEVLRELYRLGGALGDWTLDEAILAATTSIGRGETLAVERLRAAGRDDRLKQAHDAVFERLYWAPALRWAAELRLVLPLSVLALFDLAVHGASPGLRLLRRQVAELPPARGGDERMFVSALIEARHRGLLGSRREVVRRSAYRTEELRLLVRTGRWHLDRPLVVRDVRIG